jgi:hypothetical protein
MTWVQLVVKPVRALFDFLWDFLVGDTPEIFVAVCLVISLVAVIAHHRHDALGGWILVGATLAVSAFSVARAVRRSRKN